MGGLSPAQRAAQIAAGYSQNLNNQTQQGPFGTSGPGALGVGGFGPPRTGQSTNIDRSSPAGAALYQAYKDSGVVFDSNNNVIYNPADLGAAQVESTRALRGLSPSDRTTNTTSPQYLQSVYKASEGRITQVRSGIETLNAERAKIQDAARITQFDIDTLKSQIGKSPTSTSQLGDQSLFRSIQGYEANLKAQQEQLIDIDKARQNLASQEAKIKRQQTQIGFDIVSSNNAVKETTPQRQARSSSISGNQGNATNAIQKQLQYQSSINTRAEGVQSPFNNVVQTGQIKVRSPIQYSPLQGSTITARQLKQIQSGKASSIGLPTYGQSTKIVPDVLPSSSAFLSIPGIQTASAEEVPKPPKAPRQLTQSQVNALSDSEYAAYQQEFRDYKNQFDQYTGDVNRYNIIQKGDSNKKFISDVRGIVQDLYKQGHKEVNIITSSGIKTVPIGQASREAARAGAKLQAIGPSSVNVPDGIITGNLSNFPLGLSIFPEREQKPIGPQVGAAFGAQKEFERITGIQTGLQPITSRIDAAFETSKPLEQRSSDARAVGTFLAPATNLVGGLANLGKIAIGKGELTGERAGVLNLPQYKEAPQERTTLSDIVEGKPINLNDPFSRISLYGEAALFGAGLLGAKGANKVAEKAESAISKRLGVLGEKKAGKTIAEATARQSDVPYDISFTKAKNVNLYQSQELGRSIKISPKLEKSPNILERVGKIGEGKVENIVPKIPKGGEATISKPYKIPQPKIPYQYIEPRKGGITIDVLSEPIKGPKQEIGAIIKSPKGGLSQASGEQLKTLGFKLASSPEDPLDIYTIKVTDQTSKVLRQAEEAGFLKRLTDIRTFRTEDVYPVAKSGLKESRKAGDREIRKSIDIAAGRTGPKTKDRLSNLINNIKINIKEPSISESITNLGKSITQKNDYITLYHGTSKTSAENILKYGFRGGKANQIFLTPNKQFAKGYSDESQIVLEVLIKKPKLSLEGINKIIVTPKDIVQVKGLGQTFRTPIATIETTTRITPKPLPKTKAEFAKQARQQFKDLGQVGRISKELELPTTVGYYEIGDIGFQTAKGIQLGAKVSETTLKGFAQTGKSFEVGGTGLDKLLRDIGLSTGQSKSFYRPMKPLSGLPGATAKGTGGSAGKAKQLTKEDEGILRNLVPKLAGETKKKPRQDAFGDIEKSFPYAGVYGGYEQQQYAFEPESIGSKRPYGNIVINQRSPNLIDLTNFKSRQNDELKRALNVNSAIKSIKITIPKIGVQPTTRQRQPTGLIISPITGQTPAQRAPQAQRTTPLQVTEQVPKIVTPEIPKFPEVPKFPDPLKGFKFPRGGFGFLIPGGGTGGLGRSPKARIKKFVASEADPLRAGVLVPDDVTELVGYSPAVFKQIDINLGRSRRKKGASGGIDAEPFKGFGDNLLIKNNLNIRL